MTTFFPFGATNATGVGTSTIQLTARFNFTGTTMGNAVDFQLFNNQSPCDLQSINLASGANTINATACPALPSAGGVWFIPPAANIATVTLKGVSGDTGLALSPSLPTFIPFAATPPTSFVLTTSDAITGFKLAWV